MATYDHRYDSHSNDQHQKHKLQTLLAQSRQRLEHGIETRAVLDQRIKIILQAIERYRILTTGEIERDASLEALQQQLAQNNQKLAGLNSAIQQERSQIRRIAKLLWQLWVKRERRGRQQGRAASSDATSPNTTSPDHIPSNTAVPDRAKSPSPPQTEVTGAPRRRLDLLTGHVVPTCKPPNPLKALRDRPRSRFKTVVLPYATVGLLGGVAIAVIFEAIHLAPFLLLLWASLWLLAPAVIALLK